LGWEWGGRGVWCMWDVCVGGGERVWGICVRGVCVCVCVFVRVRLLCVCPATQPQPPGQTSLAAPRPPSLARPPKRAAREKKNTRRRAPGAAS
jgi:hypothetical protein